ncbi:hypothetical protein ACA910_000979 [Epithemia clementina (nom. ined.)]
MKRSADLFICVVLILSIRANGFVAPAPRALSTWACSSSLKPSSVLPPHVLGVQLEDCMERSESIIFPSTSSSIELSLDTLDPTTVLSDLLSGLFGTSAILLVPIVAALAIVGAVVFFIVSYANPTEPND